MDIDFRYVALLMALISVTTTSIAIQNVRTQQTSKSSKWYQATIGLLIVSIIGVIFIGYNIAQPTTAHAATPRHNANFLR